MANVYKNWKVGTENLAYFTDANVGQLTEFGEVTIPIDYTSGWTETDPGNDITRTSTSVSWSVMPANLASYVYRDDGAGAWDGDFVFRLNMIVELQTSSGVIGVYWGLSNQVNTYYNHTTNSGTRDDCLLVYHDAGFNRLYLYARHGTLVGDYTSVFSSVGKGSRRYLEIERDESIGTYGRLYCRIYSDSNYSNLSDTLQVDLSEKQDFRYLYAFQNEGSGSGSNYGDSSDLGEPGPGFRGQVDNVTGRLWQVEGSVAPSGGVGIKGQKLDFASSTSDVIKQQYYSDATPGVAYANLVATNAFIDDEVAQTTQAFARTSDRLKYLYFDGVEQEYMAGFIGEDGTSETLGSELATNGTMETGTPPSNWTANASTTLAAETTTVYNGTQSLKVTSGSTTLYENVGYQAITVTNGAVYKITGAYYAQSSSGATYARVYASDTVGTYDGMGVATSTQDSWVTFSFYAYVRSTTLNVCLESPNVTNAVCFFDDISVKQVTAPNANSSIVYDGPNSFTKSWVETGTNALIPDNYNDADSFQLIFHNHLERVNDAMTVVAVFSLDDPTTGSSVICGQADATYGAHRFYLEYSATTGYLSFYMYSDGSTQVGSYCNLGKHFTQLDTNRPPHVVYIGIYDGSATTCQHFVNGKELAATNVSTGPPSSLSAAGSPFVIGGRNYSEGAGGDFDGTLTALAVFGRVVDPGEINRIASYHLPRIDTRRYVDFTKGTETDTNARYTVTASNIDVSGLTEDEAANVRFDWTAGDLDSDFRLRFRVNLGSYTGGSIAGLFVMTDNNTYNDYNSMYTNNLDMIGLRLNTNSGVVLEIFESNGGSGGTFTNDTSTISTSTDYWVEFYRQEKRGTYGVIGAKIYTDSNFSGTPSDTIEVTLTETKNWDYLYAVLSNDENTAGDLISFDIWDFEVVYPKGVE